MPVLDRNYTVGFVDYRAKVLTAYASLEGYDEQGAFLPKWSVRRDRLSLLFEVKSTIPSFGELVRQINHYRTYVPSDHRFYVVSPDDRFKSDLKEENIGFVKYENSVSQPHPQGTLEI